MKAISAFKNNRLKALEHFSNDVRESASHTINQLLNAEMTLFLGKKINQTISEMVIKKETTLLKVLAQLG